MERERNSELERCIEQALGGQVNFQHDSEIKPLIMDAIVVYLESHDVITAPEVEESWRSYGEDKGGIKIAEGSNSTVRWENAWRSIGVGNNTIIKKTKKFNKAKFKDLAVKIIGDKYSGAHIVFSYKETSAIHPQNILYFRDESKALDYVRERLSPNPTEIKVVYAIQDPQTRPE